VVTTKLRNRTTEKVVGSQATTTQQQEKKKWRFLHPTNNATLRSKLQQHKGPAQEMCSGSQEPTERWPRRLPKPMRQSIREGVSHTQQWLPEVEPSTTSVAKGGQATTTTNNSGTPTSELGGQSVGGAKAHAVNPEAGAGRDHGWDRWSMEGASTKPSWRGWRPRTPTTLRPTPKGTFVPKLAPAAAADERVTTPLGAMTLACHRRGPSTEPGGELSH
jgi:hypothetical protein